MEDRVGDPDGRREELKGKPGSPSGRRHTVGAQDEQREKDREDGAAHEVRRRPRSEHGQRQAEPDEVRPVALDEREPPVQLPAAAAPNVLECVQRVQQGQVDQADELTYLADGQRRYEVRLEQKQRLNQHAEQHVREEAAHAGHERRASAGDVAERDVRNVLEPQAVHYLAQHKQRNHPERLKRADEQRLQPSPYVVRRRTLVVAEKQVDQRLDAGEEQVVESDYAQSEDAAVQETALENAVQKQRLLLSP